MSLLKVGNKNVSLCTTFLHPNSFAHLRLCFISTGLTQGSLEARGGVFRCWRICYISRLAQNQRNAVLKGSDDRYLSDKLLGIAPSSKLTEPGTVALSVVALRSSVSTNALEQPALGCVPQKQRQGLRFSHVAESHLKGKVRKASGG